MPALQVGPPRRRGGDLQPAHLPEAPLAVQREPAELAHGVGRELGHGLRRVGLEDQPRGVRAGPAGGEQRALVDHGDVGPAALGELVRERAAHDAGTDDYYPRRHRHSVLPGGGVRRTRVSLLLARLSLKTQRGVSYATVRTSEARCQGVVRHSSAAARPGRPDGDGPGLASQAWRHRSG